LGFVAEFVPSTTAQFGNHVILIRKGKSNRKVMMVSHLDTVFPPEEELRNGFRWQEEGDRIYGPGTMDIKGGTVMIWLVLSALSKHAASVFDEITWQIFLNASEEKLTKDLADLCRSRIDGQTLAALVFEAEGRSNQNPSIVVARKGRATWRVSVTGRGAHAGVKHRYGANALVQLSKTIHQIAALTDYSKDLTFNVGTAHGGTGFNRVPHEAFAEGEFRAFSQDIYAQGRNSLLGLAGLGEVCSPADDYRCSIAVQILNETTPWAPNPQTDSLFELWMQAGNELGLPLGREERAGLSDGNLLYDAVPTLDGLGPWGDNDHCSERSADGSKVPEFVVVSSFVPKAMLNVDAILKLVQQPR
jgi:glutamate carboxypeptidase